MIPKGHPIYNYNNSYSSVIREYLGEFAASTNEESLYNTVCDVHTYAWQQNYQQNNTSLAQSAQELVNYAYNAVGAAGDAISNDTRRNINAAISAIESLIYSEYYDSATLQNAMTNLQSALSLAGL